MIRRGIVGAHNPHALGFGELRSVRLEGPARGCYFHGRRDVLDMIESGRAPLSDQELLEPVRVLASIERSRVTGEAVNL